LQLRFSKSFCTNWSSSFPSVPTRFQGYLTVRRTMNYLFDQFLSTFVFLIFSNFIYMLLDVLSLIMSLVGRSHKTNSNSYFGRGRPDDENLCADDPGEDCKEGDVNQRISVTLLTISRKSRTSQTQTFPSVTIPTALTSSTFRSVSVNKFPVATLY
jgi:hypothetical protein